jgi:hypothetical protein
MGEAADGLEQVRQQRAALAERVTLPWWYLVLFTAAIVALLSSPFASRYGSPGLSDLVFLPALVIMVGLDRLLGYATGAKLSRRTMLAYPSTRPAGVAVIVTVGAAVVGVNALLGSGQVAVAVGVVVVAAAAAVGCLVRLTAAIRDDIREGRAVTR